jgi:hypothetical protein
MGGAPMTVYAAVIPIAILVGLPLWTAPSLSVLLVGAVSASLCAAGVLRLRMAPLTLGGSLALIDYALAASLARNGLDIVGATVFGLALVFLVDVNETVRRFRGAEVTAAVRRAQIAFWLGRAAVAIVAVVLLSLAAAVFAPIVPVLGRPVLAGSGAVIAFVGALRSGIVHGQNEG